MFDSGVLITEGKHSETQNGRGLNKRRSMQQSYKRPARHFFSYFGFFPVASQHLSTFS